MSKVVFTGLLTITELILERAGPILFKTFSLKFIAFRLIPAMCPARQAKTKEITNEKVLRAIKRGLLLVPEPSVPLAGPPFP